MGALIYIGVNNMSKKKEVQKKVQKDDDVKRNLFLIIILAILCIIIFLFIRTFAFIDHDGRIPTGNVDIFEITFDPTGGDSCENPTTKTTKKPNKTKTTSSTKKVTTTTKFDVDVFDKDSSYTYQRELNIFTQVSYYVVEGKIAPTSYNSYDFVIKNNNSFNIIYGLEMIETNKFNINMRYRLKKNGKYIVGSEKEYVTADQLHQYNIKLKANKSDTYTLDWKWFESSNDTQIGENVAASYKLDIKINAVSD